MQQRGWEGKKTVRKRRAEVSQWSRAAYTKHLLSCLRQPTLQKVSLKPVEKGEKGREKTLRNAEWEKHLSFIWCRFALAPDSAQL